MKRFVFVAGVLLSGVVAYAQAPTTRATASTVSPPGWDATAAQLMDLELAGKLEERVAIVEPFVVKYPLFAEGHARLGGAHETVARGLMRTDPTRARARFEIAATHLRRAFDLGGGRYPDTTIRGLIDLYEYALPSPDKWKATVLDALARYPAQPVSHWYGLQLLLRDGRAAELGPALKSARLAVPSTPSDARLELAELIVALAKKTTSTEARATLATEALAFADETLAAHPNDGLGPRVASIKEEAGRLQGKKGR